MTKLEICAIEDTNPGQVYLYPDGSFYKAYQKSARPLKGLDGPLLRLRVTDKKVLYLYSMKRNLIMDLGYIMLFVMLFMLIPTEKALKNNFDEFGRPRS